MSVGTGQPRSVNPGTGGPFVTIPPSSAAALAYEKRLDSNLEWALDEGGKFFESTSEVHQALRKIARLLDEHGIPYAVCGGMALFLHGFRRFTEDVDILVTREGLESIHEKLEGRGYLPPFRGSKNLRDTEFGVRIEFLITGGFPGDGQPKPVSFPDPGKVGVESGGIKHLNLPTLVELKLASGMSLADRMKDLADVIELIKALSLGRDFADKIDPSVRAKYGELWDSMFQGDKKYMTMLSSEVLPREPNDFDDLIRMIGTSLERINGMRSEGVTLARGPDAGVGSIYLVTTDPAVARKYDMHAEDEFLGATGSQSGGPGR